jgi:prepilin-type N-terminal cleavage/methylation domain-containing protein
MTMKRSAFTLVELLVVIAIIGLMSTIAVVGLSSSQVNSRNTTRKAGLVQISKALELYYTDNGSYPSTSNAWRGNCSLYGSLPDAGAGAWIPNFTAYMQTLPHDPRSGMSNPSSTQPACQTPGQNCFLYRSEGTDYKLLAHCTPEGTMSASDFFYDSGRPTWAWQVSSDGGRFW